jgi:SAM-dependent methyltransferase
MLQNSYNSQDRGSQNEYLQYLSAMDKVIVEKVASASVFFDPTPGNSIVDIGMASGTSSNILAHLFPKLNIIGVDINPKMVEIASNTYNASNLEFRIDDGEGLKTFEENTIGGFFNCSSIHHITSFNNYNSNRAFNTLKRQAALLKPGGIIVVRDFVKPPEMEVILELSDIKGNDRLSCSELLISFSQNARSLSNKEEKGFPIIEITSQNKNSRRFRLFYADAVEFIRRKDYLDHWDIELQEEYGYFTQKEFEEIFSNLGLRTIVSYPIFNPWIVSNRYKNKFTLYDKNLNDIGFPPTNYLIAGEKVINKGTYIKTARHLPEPENPFLKYTAYKDSHTNKIYDVVHRPNSVVDVVPFYIHNNRIEILAKHGYPRPIVNIETDSPIIDQKHFSGYIIEGITASQGQSIELILVERTNIKSSDIVKVEKSLEYYTSPGGIDEKVESAFIELNDISEIEFSPNKSYSGFSDSGSIRKYDASQLLKTAQTGALVEARLELNIYNLFHKLKLNIPQWFGEKIQIEELAIPKITTLSQILAISETRYEQTIETANYLQKHRAKFIETNIPESAQILEFVTPKTTSNNTLLTLPVIKYKNEIYVGLEVRNLPVPQIHTGNSCLVVVPAWRLPEQVKNYKDLENQIFQLNFNGAKVTSFNKLGEKFFPSVGVTPEQVYPYIVGLNAATDELQWVSLTELYNNLEAIKDGHLLISVFRLMNALGFS